MRAGAPHRCSWAEGDPLLRAYHDEEWGVAEYDSRAHYHFSFESSVTGSILKVPLPGKDLRAASEAVVFPAAIVIVNGEAARMQPHNLRLCRQRTCRLYTKFTLTMPF